MNSLLKRHTAAVFLALALVAGSAVATATPAEAATRLGGIDMVQACKQQYANYFNVVHGSTVVSWQCNYSTYGVYGQWTGIRSGGLDLNRYCRGKWAGSWASYTNYYDVYSWSCVK